MLREKALEKFKTIEKYQEIITNHPVIIADGHHRFQTCLWHSKNGGCKYIMALFIDFNDPGLIIYTSHRQIHRVFAKNIEEIKERVSDKFETRDIEDIKAMKKIMKQYKDIMFLDVISITNIFF